MFDNTPRLAFWKLVVVALCLCVFIFGTHARLAQYHNLSSNVVTVGEAKLWIGDHRMEIQSEVTGLVVLALAAWLACALRLTVLPLAQLFIPAPVSIVQVWHLQRFFRPPPIR